MESKKASAISRPAVAAILLSATALGLAGAWYVLGAPIYRATATYKPAPSTWPSSRLAPGATSVVTATLSSSIPVGTSPLTVDKMAGAVAVVLAAWSWAMAWVGWRGRHAPDRGPGLAACIAATVVSAFYLSAHLVMAAVWGWPMPGLSSIDGWPMMDVAFFDDVQQAGANVNSIYMVDDFAYKVLPDLGRIVAPAVLGALLLSIAARRRRPVGWVEWASLAVGLGWLAVGLVLLLSRSDGP